MTIYDHYPDADILSQRGHWDDATRHVVMDRVHNVPSFQHFGPQQQATLEALCDRLIPQSHKPPERRVPIARWIDLNTGKEAIAGFQFDDMPPNPDAWNWGLEGLNETSRELFSMDFVDLDAGKQDEVLEAVRKGDPPGEVWKRMPAGRWWINVALRQVCGVYYSHPQAWDEIGFGGPAYPRGYFALNFGAPEPWEPREIPAPGEVIYRETKR